MAGKTVTKTMQTKWEQPNGREFYAYLFDHYPDVRKYFKGHESKTGADVLKSDQFMKLGDTLSLAVRVLGALHEDTPTFKSYTDEIIDRHVRRNINLDPKLWSQFWQIFLEYLGTKGAVDEGTKKAFLEVGNDFATECQSHLKAIGK